MDRNHETSDTKQAKPIFICGMDRSGTSLLGQMVLRWGAFGGDVDQLSQGDRFNPAGYYENRALQSLFRQVFRGRIPADDTYLETMREKAQHPEHRALVANLVDSMSSDAVTWFWKEPALSVMVPFWESFFKEIVFVIPVRDPYESALSWHKFRVPEKLQDHLDMVPATLMRWQYLFHRLLPAIEPHAKIFIRYDELLADPDAQAKRLAGFLDDQYDRRTDEKTLAEMTAAVQTDLYRNKSQEPFDERADVSPEQKDFYRFLLQKCGDAALPLASSLAPPPVAWQTHLDNLQFAINYYQAHSPLIENKLVIAMRIAFFYIMRPFRKIFRR